MKEFKYTIKDELGIHARPAGLLVKEAAAFPCKVTIEKGGKEITLRTDGDQEDTAMETLSKFLETNL